MRISLEEQGFQQQYIILKRNISKKEKMGSHRKTYNMHKRTIFSYFLSIC